MNIEIEQHRVQTFVEKGNFHAAINIALSALNECRRSENQTDVDKFLLIIKGIVQTLNDKFGSQP